MTAAPRLTRQRAAILGALEESSDFRSAQDWHDTLRHAGHSIGLATVYRALQALAESGEVDQVIGTDGQALYRSCGDRHHHHLRCRACGAAAEIEGPGVEEWAARVAAQHGYSGIEHTVELTGICADCAASGAS